MTPDLRRTALYDRHVAAGAKMVDFAGWEMPVQYEGVRQEHMAVRRSCGIFDVSHMGEIETSGPQALELLQRLLSNDVSALAPDGAQYSVLCREDGGVLDDLFTYRLGVRSLSHGHQRLQPPDRPGLVQRPRRGLPGGNGRGSHRRVGDAGRPGAAGAGDRAGDLRLPAARADERGDQAPGGHRGARLRNRLHRRGRRRAALPRPTTRRRSGTRWSGAAPCPAGLGARDTLRLEVCFHLYGNDLSVQRGPIEAGLGWCCKEDTGFIGSDAVRAVREAGPAEKLVAFEIDGPGIARQGNPVIGGGVVTSGTLSPCLEHRHRHGLRARRSSAQIGTPSGDRRAGRSRSAVVVRKPFVEKRA